jgi:tetratricopeptide (TPR) repeat protein
MSQDNVAGRESSWQSWIERLDEVYRNSLHDVVGLHKLRTDLESTVGLIPRDAHSIRLRAARLLAETSTQLGLHDTVYEILVGALDLDSASLSERDSLKLALASAAIKAERQEECLELLDHSRKPNECEPTISLAAHEILMSLGRRAEATQRLEDLATQQCPPSLVFAAALQSLGIILDESGRSTEALSVFTRAYSVLRMSTGDEEASLRYYSSLHNSLSVCLLNLGRIDEAVREADKAILAAHATGNTKDLAVALLTRGNACHAGGQIEIALTHFNNALVASGWSESESRRLEITLLNNIALSYLELGQPILYMRYLLWALDVAEELGEWRAKAMALCNLATLSDRLKLESC